MSNPKKETFEEGYKRCGTCDEIKPLLDFRKTKDGYRGVAGTCKICTSIKTKQYQDSPKYRLTYHDRTWKKFPIKHEYRPDFKFICAVCSKEFIIVGTPKGYKKALFCSIQESYDKKQQTCSKSCSDKYFNKRIGTEKRRERYKNDAEYRNKILDFQNEVRKTEEYKKYRIEYQREYRKENKEKVNTYQSKWASDKRKTDLSYKMMELLRKRVLGVLKETGFYKEETTLELIGADVEFIQEYLESQFEEGMSWDNWTPKGWHLDHIRPCSTFDLSDINQQRICFNWRNLQPLWGHINTSKKDLYTKEDEEVWVKRMKDLGFEGDLFKKFP